MGKIAVLIDPEKCNKITELEILVRKSELVGVNYFFVGGSTVTRKDFTTTIKHLKSLTNIPIIIFPGAAHQISKNADALLYLSLISGRNPDFLIGHHVNSANEVYDLNIEVIPTAYILIDGGTHSSVAYVSQTTPIPADQTGIILNTVKAGLMQGKQLIYFDAGSGALQHVPAEVIRETKKLGAPIVVGGGINSLGKIREIQNAGANLIVIGNKIEEESDFLLQLNGYLNETNV